MDAGLKKAIAAVGSKKKFAVALRVSPQAISQWDRVPEKRVHAVARITGLTPNVLRPDLYKAALRFVDAVP